MSELGPNERDLEAVRNALGIINGRLNELERFVKDTRDKLFPQVWQNHNRIDALQRTATSAIKRETDILNRLDDLEAVIKCFHGNDAFDAIGFGKQPWGDAPNGHDPTVSKED